MSGQPMSGIRTRESDRPVHDASPASQDGRGSKLSSGAALLLLGLSRRSLAGGILAAIGGRLAYSALKGRTLTAPKAHQDAQHGGHARSKLCAAQVAENGNASERDQIEQSRAQVSWHETHGSRMDPRRDRTRPSSDSRSAASWKQLLLDPQALLGIVKEAISAWSADRVPSLAAALAYYTTFSLAPLLLIVIAVVGVFFGARAAQGTIVQEIGGVIGKSGVEAVQTMLQSAHKPGTGSLAAIIGVVALLIGAGGVFQELQDSLTIIWRVPNQHKGFLQTLKDRFLSYGMVLGVGFLLLVSLMLSAAIAAAGKFFGGLLPFSEAILHLLTFGVSFAVVTVLFAMIFKILPRAPVPWRHVWPGAVFTALLFNLGKLAIGLYLGKSSIGSAYGAASSLLVMLAWVYYSAQILYFGASFTRAYASNRGYRPPGG